MSGYHFQPLAGQQRKKLRCVKGSGNKYGSDGSAAIILKRVGGKPGSWKLHKSGSALRASQPLARMSFCPLVGSHNSASRKRPSSRSKVSASKVPRTSVARGTQPLARSPNKYRVVFDGSVSEVDHVAHCCRKGFGIRCEMQERGNV